MSTTAAARTNTEDDLNTTTNHETGLERPLEMNAEDTLAVAGACVREYIERRCLDVPVVVSQGWFASPPSDDEVPLLRVRIAEAVVGEGGDHEFPKHAHMTVRATVVAYWAQGGNPARAIPHRPHEVEHERGVSFIDVEGGHDSALKEHHRRGERSGKAVGNASLTAYGNDLRGGVQCVSRDVLLRFVIANGDESDNFRPRSASVTLNDIKQEKRDAEARADAWGYVNERKPGSIATRGGLWTA